jgi:predicted PurR-regulated permease PerM
MPSKPRPPRTPLKVVGALMLVVMMVALFGAGGLFAAVILAFFVWVTRDAGETTKDLKARRRRVKPGRDGDMSDVAGVIKRDPWLG